MSSEDLIKQIEATKNFDLLFKLKNNLYWFGFNSEIFRRILNSKVWSDFDDKVRHYSRLVFKKSGGKDFSPTIAWLFFPECYDIGQHPIDLPLYRVDITAMLAYSYHWGNLLAGALFLTRFLRYIEQGDVLGNKYKLTIPEVSKLQQLYIELYNYNPDEVYEQIVKILVYTELQQTLPLFDTSTRESLQIEMKHTTNFSLQQLLEHAYQFESTGLASYLYYKQIGKKHILADALFNRSLRCKCELALLEKNFRQPENLVEIAKKGQPYAWQLYGDILFAEQRYEEAFEIYRTSSLNGYMTSFAYGAEKFKRRRPDLAKKLLVEAYERGDVNIITTLFYNYPCEEYEQKMRKITDLRLKMDYGSTLDDSRNKGIAKEIQDRFANRVIKMLMILE